jgi:VanZ family protein
LRRSGHIWPNDRPDAFGRVRYDPTSMPPSLFRLAFLAAVVGALALALWPLDSPPPLHTGWDKTDHLFGFVVLGLLGQAGWPRKRGWVLAGLLAFGVLIELLQGLTGYRFADSRDVLADWLGVGLAALLWSLGLLAARRPV